MANRSVEEKRGTSSIASLAGKVLANTGPLLILVALWIILMILSEPFRNPNTWGLLALEVAAIGIVAAGQTFVILTGGIDLSVEAMVSFAGVLAAILIAGTSVAGGQIANGLPSMVAIPIALAGRRWHRHVPGYADHAVSHEPTDRDAGLSQYAAGRGAGVDARRGHQHPQGRPADRHHQRDPRGHLSDTRAISDRPAGLLRQLVCTQAHQVRPLHLRHRRQRDGRPPVGHPRRSGQGDASTASAAFWPPSAASW